jgi:hypothetical protein
MVTTHSGTPCDRPLGYPTWGTHWGTTLVGTPLRETRGGPSWGRTTWALLLALLCDPPLRNFVVGFTFRYIIKRTPSCDPTWETTLGGPPMEEPPWESQVGAPLENPLYGQSLGNPLWWPYLGYHPLGTTLPGQPFGDQQR